MKRVVVAALFGLFACGDSDGAVEMTGSGTDGGSTSWTSFGTDATTADPGTAASSSGSTTGEGSTTTTGGEEPLQPLVWSDDCIVAGADLKELDPRLQCTALEVPIDHGDPDSTPITIAALRVQTTANERKGQFWMLDGGPGGSGLGFFDQKEILEPLLDAGWDVIVPPHRGTVSPQLRCTADAASSLCREELEAQWGDDVRHFNTVQAAHDVAALVARTEAELDEPTVVYGISYGTYWAQTYFSLYPQQAEGIILDSVLPLGGSILEQELHTQDRGVDLLQRCIDDATCSSHVPFESGQEFADAVVAALDNGDCGAGDPGAWADSPHRSTFGPLVNIHKTRNYLPLLAALLQTCTPENSALAQDAMQQLLNLSFGAAPPPPMPLRWWPVQSVRKPNAAIPFELYYTQELFSTVAGTTLVGDDEQFSEPLADAASNLLTLGMLEGVAFSTEAWASMPNVETPTLIAPSAPVLLINGRYDLQTVLPWAEAVATTIGVEPLVIDDGSHGVIFPGSGGEGIDDTPCALPAMLAFSADPEGAHDLSCFDSLPPLDVSLQRPDLQDWSLQVFGTTDPWSLVSG